MKKTYIKFKKKTKKKTKIFTKGLRLILFTIINRILIILLPTDVDKILFLSEVREELGGNLKSMYDYIDGSQYNKIILLKANRRERRNIKEKLKLIYHLSTSKYIFLDDFVSSISYIKKRKQQKICQLWHGAGAYKKFGFSRSRSNEKFKHIHRGHTKYTNVSVSSVDIKWCYSEAFGIKTDNIKALGVPRTDKLLDKNYQKKIRKQFFHTYPELKNKKIILFAPTYRGSNLKKASYDFAQLDLEKLYTKLSKEYVFLFKWHPATFANLQKGRTIDFDYEKYDEFFYDFSDLRDLNDLLIICDIFITDYSSSIFDYSLLNKPIIYYAYDLDKYVNGRGLYFGFNDYVYGEVAENMDELMLAIKKENMSNTKRKEFNEKFMSCCDGNSTKKIYEWIFKNK